MDRLRGDVMLGRATDDSVTAPDPAVVLRFLAAPMDVTYGGTVHGGKLLEWIDKAGYACAAGWSKHYCVTVYVGDVRFTRPVAIGELVEVEAQLVHTGRTSMHILVSVSSADPKTGTFTEATRCLTVFVAVDAEGRPTEVPTWVPHTPEAAELQAGALRSAQVRADIEASMREQTYSTAGTAPESTLRFLAAPTDVNWGGKVHGGTVMRWIDEAAYVCAVGWIHGRAIAVYAGGVRFYRPLLIGSVVETRARLVHTGPHSMHISVHVHSGDPRDERRDLTTHCMMIFVGLDDAQRPAEVPAWTPRSAEDVALDRHATHLAALRTRADLLDRELPRVADRV
jgi:4-hydroxybenzoyl-CoA thioesterase